MSNERKKKTQLLGALLLLLTAFIWGVAFVAQSVGMDSVEGFTFSGIRTLLGAIVLLPVVLFRNHKAKKPLDEIQLKAHKATTKKTILYGMILGVVFCAAGNFQQFAFNYTTSGKIAFITAMYMFFVPLIGIFLKKKTPALTWLCVALGFIGMFFLCMNPNDMTGLNKGDLLAIICSIFFAVHILTIEKFAPGVDGIMLSCVQFFTGGAISCVLMFIFEDPQIAAIKAAIVPILYAGVLSCGLAYTFQIIGQKYTEATVASIIMSMESVFGALAGALLLHEMLSGREIIGCIIMFVAIILSQLSEVLTSKMRAKKNAVG
ncbi:MAG: DMT family transporter [Eubacterium sp.]|nr:DMT family transporter [Eubacterium sp.]